MPAAPGPQALSGHEESHEPRDVSSPNWGEREVRKLYAELAEIDALAIRAVVDHCASRPGRAARRSARG